MKKQKWIYSVGVKIISWILLISMACTTALFAIGIKIIQADNFYNSSFQNAEKTVMIHEAGAYKDASMVISEVINDYYDLASERGTTKNITYKVTDESGKVLLDEKTTAKNLIQFDVELEMGAAPEGQTVIEQMYTATVTIDADFPYHDRYETWHQITKLLYSMQYSIYFLTIGAFVLGLLAFIILLLGAGHSTKDEEIHTGWLYKIPGDLYIILWIGLTASVTGVFGSVAEQMSNTDYGMLYYIGAIFLFVGCMTAAGLLNLAVRVKKGGFWQHTFLWWMIKSLAHAFDSLGLKAWIIWILIGLFFLELCAIAFYGSGSSIVFWVLRTCILFGLCIWLADVLKQLIKGTQMLAAGDLSYQIDTSKMKGPFRQAGENLNHIAIGMSKAVDDRMKSERMKTELITNVSHDIKTPLTSIINYTDLISKEPCENEKIKEYTEVLTRQSERLKKLIEDLIEASKASTGNLEVLLEPCEVNVLLSQAVGEYEEKFKKNDLELIMMQPDHPVTILADGRRMWRVFDNLLNNICKYSQNGTRVYLDLSEKNSKAEIIFKNTSRDALNISVDELKERFVRGDSSRNTEGNGLGLSIAQSLTELQKGTMDLQVDGDLFKVILQFPKI